MPAISVHKQVLPLTMRSVLETLDHRIVGTAEDSNAGDSPVSRHNTILFQHLVSSDLDVPAFFHPILSELRYRLKTADGYAPVVVVTVAPDGVHLRFRGVDAHNMPTDKYGFFDVKPLVTKTVAFENVVDAALFLGAHPNCMATDCTGAKGKKLELHRSVVFSPTGSYADQRAYCGKCFDREYFSLNREHVLFDGRGSWLHSPVMVMER